MYFERVFLWAVASLMALTVAAQSVNQQLKNNDPAFLTSEEARQIGRQVLLYQRVTGGWPKNIDMARPLSADEQAEVAAQKNRRNDSTTDNGATTLQMKFLARLYQATGDTAYQQGFCRGVEYLLSGQYANGGWPQFWPEMREYQIHITYNDNAMVSTMLLLRDIVQQKKPYQADLTSADLRRKAQEAFDKGVECILATQIRVDGRPTVWCQQHDRETLAPAKARAYELPSFCSQESAAIVRLLMQLPHPDQRVKDAIKGAMTWFDEHKIMGYRLVKTGKKGEPGANTQLVSDSTAGPLWARYYDLEHGRPFVCDRDGIPRQHLEEISLERRNGYSWYNKYPAELYPLYEQWLALHANEP